MRIISGSARGKRLTSFTGEEIRPTPDRVREAVFSILGSRLGPIAGMRVLDLFAGTGAMAIEALSRGAASAVLVDNGKQAVKLIPANLRTCGMDERATFIRADALKTLPRLADNAPFDLVFLDPPYNRGLVLPVVTALSDFGLLAPGGLLCAETERQDEIPAKIGTLVRIDQRHYGSTAVHFFAHPDVEA